MENGSALNVQNIREPRYLSAPGKWLFDLRINVTPTQYVLLKECVLLQRRTDGSMTVFPPSLRSEGQAFAQVEFSGEFAARVKNAVVSALEAHTAVL